MYIYVVNKRTHIPHFATTDVYIGRGSVLGNPYTHKNGTTAKHICASRDEAIDKYRLYFNEQIKDKDGEFIKELRRIYLLACKTEVNLVCYCAPKKCHGSIIREFLIKHS